MIGGASPPRWRARRLLVCDERNATMQLLTIAPSAVTVDLDATACLVLADALATAIHDDACPDDRLVNALRAALEAYAVLSATDTLRDSQVPEAGMLAHTREVWGPLDVQHPGIPRMTRRPR